MAGPSNDFPESVKEEARKQAGFKCCYCRERVGDEVHHLLPREEGGLGVLENAILLCAQCHTDYGHRPDKRKQLRQARDDWYEIVKDRQRPADHAVLERLQDLATKQDIEQLKIEVGGLFNTFMASFIHGSTSSQQVVNVASIMANSIVYPPTVVQSPVFNRQCIKCGKPYTATNFTDPCPNCG